MTSFDDMQDNKARVLDTFPEAHCVVSPLKRDATSDCIVYGDEVGGHNLVVGRGRSEAQAWANAAKRIYEGDFN